MKTVIKFLSFSILLSFLFTNCVKEDFDRPPISSIPIGNVLTIADLIQIYNQVEDTVFTTDNSVYATVTMDDRSGNIYRNAYIQDGTGAINLHLNEPGGLSIGDSIRVYLKNCILSEYSGLLQIDNVHNDSNIIIIANRQYIEPETVTIPEILTGNYESHLIKLNDVQFAEYELGKTYAKTDESTNRILEDCDFNTLIVRTSSYANFAEDLLPEGKGSLIACVGRYNDDWQLYIRTVTEVDLNGERCNGGGGVTPVDEIHEYFDDAVNYEDINIEGWVNAMITGDRRWQGKEYNTEKYAQATGYNSGLSEMVTWLITPPVKTDNDNKLSFLSAKAYWEHQSDNGLTVWASTDFDGENIETATWVELNARIANENDPDHEWIESGEIDLSAFPDYCYIGFKYFGSETESTSFRLDDIVVASSGGGTGGVTSIDEDFEGQQNYEDIYIEGWLNAMTTGNRMWQGKEYDANLYAQATSYNSGEQNVCWLITPEIDLDAMTNPRFEFESAQAYWLHDGLEVIISTDFDGVNIDDATWVDLDAVIADQDDPDHEWIPSGQIDLSGYSGSAYIGFKYTGSDPDETTSYRIDNVKLYEE